MITWSILSRDGLAGVGATATSVTVGVEVGGLRRILASNCNRRLH